MKYKYYYHFWRYMHHSHHHSYLSSKIKRKEKLNGIHNEKDQLFKIPVISQEIFLYIVLFFSNNKKQN